MVTLSRFVCATLSFVFAHNSAFADDNLTPTNTEAVLIAIATTCHDDLRDPPKVDQIRLYIESNGVDSNVVIDVLMNFAQGKNLPSDNSATIGRFSLLMLADMRVRDALPIFSQHLATTKTPTDAEIQMDPQMAMRCILRLGLDESLSLARRVVAHTQEHSGLDRFYVYEELGKFLISTNGAVSSDFKNKTTEFLMQSALTEPTTENFVVIDKLLCAHETNYRDGTTRKSLLASHQNKASVRDAAYLQDQLRTLQTR